MVYLAFYKAKGKLIDRLIRYWTAGKYSHCELLFSDNSWFSADAWKGKVRYDRFEPNKDNWDFVEVKTSSKEEMILRAWCDSKVGKKYDWWGILGFIFSFNLENPNRYFCSELCVEALQQIGKFKRQIPHNISPSSLALICGLN